MGIADLFEKSKEKGQGIPPPPGHTIAEILQDKSSFYLFTRLLERDGQEALGARLVAGKLEQDDINLLAEYRAKFSEKITQSEKIEKLLTEENVIGIARNHPDFAKIIDSLTPKQLIKVIRSQLKEICITDENRFDAIADPIETYDSYKKGDYKKTSEEIEKSCDDMNISQKDYLAALAIKDPDEKKVALRKLARGEYGKFMTACNSIFGIERRNLKSLKDSEKSLEDLFAKLNSYKQDIGSTLFLSVSGNDDMRNALSRELVGDKTQAETAEPRLGFSDLKKESAGAFNEAKLDKDWEDYKTRAGYDTEDDAGKDTIKDMFIEEQKETYGKRKAKNTGFLARILAALFEEKINSKKATLK